ncbi:hypothetical protein SAMN05421858_5047 [Haladaptatus litoreus]|uniref:Uncharacterized protein n=1 Tax=Haladaptatus litoreus TaxID=553468 RepID=A0A1N7FGY0_9EURY|nr:hypothetical protein [Haladaptatus litoreus]SIR99629.1 hypothetical protein SAMN05421858_5047 [Haladaptatus litoreus]
MPRNTETIDLREEADRIDSELDEIAEKVARLNDEADEDDEDDANAELVGEIEESFEKVDQLERELVGVHWALDEWGDNRCGAEKDDGGTCQNPADSCPHHDSVGGTVELTIGGLTTGEFADVQDRTNTARNEKVGWGSDPSVEAAGSIFQAAKGLVDADFLSDDPEFFEKQQLVSNSAPQFKEWLSARVDDLTTPNVDTGNFSERLERAQAKLES